MKSDWIRCLGSAGFHRMHYYERGDPRNPRIVFCVHGLTRSARDFDFMAEALAVDFRVICPDVVGRGKSDWLEAKQDYAYPQYMSDLTALIARVTNGADATIDWVGTSMGALIGIFMAALPRSPIGRLVLNDAGTLVPKAALERIGRYVGRDPRFPSLEALEAHLRWISQPFGPLTDAQWRHLTETCATHHPDGSWGFSYDPAIGKPLEGELQDLDLSAFYDRITAPTLVLRGATSDILLRETAEAMSRRGPKARLVEFAGIGHAPMLLTEEQVAPVREFLLAG